MSEPTDRSLSAHQLQAMATRFDQQVRWLEAVITRLRPARGELERLGKHGIGKKPRTHEREFATLACEVTAGLIQLSDTVSLLDLVQRVASNNIPLAE